MSDEFGDRMKEYEAVTDLKLTRKLPIIIRLDGNSFSKLTKDLNLDKPFDQRFQSAMAMTTEAVMKYCSGSQLGYYQSDEITILLRNDQTLQTEPFLANRLEKLCSLVASLASVRFTKEISHYFPEAQGIFDCRVFIVPSSEVNNAFLWRQQDAFKNCVSGVAYYGLKAKYGKKEAMRRLHGLNTNEKQEIIFQELGINMNNYPTAYKRGACIHRETVQLPITHFLTTDEIKSFNKDENEIVTRSVYKHDTEIPLFNQNPNYVNRFLVDAEKDLTGLSQAW